MASINSVNLCGRVTKEIEVNITETNKKVTRFSLAVQRNKEVADFINCQAWEGTADLLQRYVRKGDKINVQGCIRTASYNTQNGKVYQTYVLVNQIELLEKKDYQSQKQVVHEEPKEEPKTSFDEPTYDINVDDLPFF